MQFIKATLSQLMIKIVYKKKCSALNEKWNWNCHSNVSIKIVEFISFKELPINAMLMDHRMCIHIDDNCPVIIFSFLFFTYLPLPLAITSSSSSSSLSLSSSTYKHRHRPSLAKQASEIGIVLQHAKCKPTHALLSHLSSGWFLVFCTPMQLE